MHHIITDKFGYIWIGTINGLTQFDGYEFKRFYFNPNDTLTIHGLEVQSLYEDHKGQIWVDAGPSNLNMYNPATSVFRQYQFAKLIEHTADIQVEIQSICEDNNGRIYFGAGAYRGENISTSLLYKDEKDDTLKLFKCPDSLQIRNIYSMTKDNSGNIFFISNTNLFKIDTKGKLSKLHLPQLQYAFNKNKEHPDDIRFDKDGFMWIIGCKSSLFRFSITDSSCQVFTPPGKHFDENFFNTIVFDHYQNIWMGTNNGVIKYKNQKMQFEFFENESKKQFVKADTRGLQLDTFGTLWIATATLVCSGMKKKRCLNLIVITKTIKIL